MVGQPENGGAPRAACLPVSDTGTQTASGTQVVPTAKCPVVLVIFVAGMGLTILTMAVWAGLLILRSVTPSPSYPPPAILGTAPEFDFIERSGKQLGSQMLRGRVWVVDFIFTHCAGPCPIMTATMARLQSAIEDLPDVRLVSISVDPDRDTPEVLAGYADRYGADKNRWLFLTGDLAAIKKVTVDGFKLGSKDDPILHSDRFVLVDKAGRIRGYFDSMEEDVIDRLLAAIRVLRWEGDR